MIALMDHLLDAPNQNVRDMALAARDGCQGALEALWDACLEGGIMLPLKPGTTWLFRTITNYFTGTVREVTPLYIKVDNVAWIADTGRLANCVSTGQVEECEVYPKEVVVYLMVAPLVDVIEWKHKPPTQTK